MALTRVSRDFLKDGVRARMLDDWRSDAAYSEVPSYVVGSDGEEYKSTTANGVDESGLDIGPGVINPVTDDTGVWEPFSSAGATGGGRNEVFYENDKIVTESYTLTSNKNAMTAGPIQIGDPKDLSLISSDGAEISGTTATDHGLSVGDAVAISETNNYNGEYTVSAVPTSTTFTITSALNELEETSGKIEKEVVVTIEDGATWTVV